MEKSGLSRAVALGALAAALLLPAAPAYAQNRGEHGSWGQRERPENARSERAAARPGGDRGEWSQQRAPQRSEPGEHFRMPDARQAAPAQAPSVRAAAPHGYGTNEARSYGAFRDRSYGATMRGVSHDGGERRADARESRQDFRHGYRAGDHRGGDAVYGQGYRQGRREDWREDRGHDQRGYAQGYRAGDPHRPWDNRGWRNDNRYDWYRYRAANRSLFSLGRYYAPYRGYGYSRLSIGVRLGSPFYSSRYWINDPWRYRLPDVYGPYRWVRYYDDALLVDVDSGEVVDVIHNLFW